MGSDQVIPQQNWFHCRGARLRRDHGPRPVERHVRDFRRVRIQKAGRIVGPRIFSTGTILYGATTPFTAEIETLDDARSHLRRLQASGAWSVKSYNQPRREQRQMIIQAARELGMEVVPEGGSLFMMNMTRSPTATRRSNIRSRSPMSTTTCSNSGEGQQDRLHADPGGRLRRAVRRELLVPEDQGVGGADPVRWVPRPLIDARARRVGDESRRENNLPFDRSPRPPSASATSASRSRSAPTASARGSARIGTCGCSSWAA